MKNTGPEGLAARRNLLIYALDATSGSVALAWRWLATFCSQRDRALVVICQRQIESSYSLPNRKFRFWGRPESPHDNLEPLWRGRACRGAQGRCDGDGSEEIGTKPSGDPRGFPFTRPAGSQGRQPPHLTACSEATTCPAAFAGQGGAARFAGSLHNDVVERLHFFGESSERRPWA